jgi:hypothetical protein
VPGPKSAGPWSKSARPPLPYHHKLDTRHSTLDTLAGPRRLDSPSSKRAVSLCSARGAHITHRHGTLRSSARLLAADKHPCPIVTVNTSVDYQSMRIFQKPRLAANGYHRRYKPRAYCVRNIRPDCTQDPRQNGFVPPCDQHLTLPSSQNHVSTQIQASDANSNDPAYSLSRRYYLVTPPTAKPCVTPPGLCSWAAISSGSCVYASHPLPGLTQRAQFVYPRPRAV